MNRRTFLKVGTLGTAALISGGAQGAAPAVTPMFRTLGRTGMKITTISMGAMRTGEVAVFRAAMDMGINYIDTARVYMDGRNESIVGEALQGYRDKVYVATKVKPGTKEEMWKSIDESLAGLKLDYVDLLQLHDISAKDGVMNPQYREVLAEAKKKGKTRFIGITVHKNEVETLNNIVDDPEKFFDTVLVTYNFSTFQKTPAIKEAIARAVQANIGVIAMKTQGGGYKTKELGDISPHQAALKFVLNDKNVTAAVPSMVDLSQLKEDVAVMGMKFAESDRELLETYAAAIRSRYCHRCGVCTPTCPFAVDIAHINRSLMYAEGYGDVALARATYGELPAARGLDQCAACPVCTAQCVNGLNIAERMNKARTVFA
jgi:predicted aldo/keto reductase-like oxidoreductase